MKKYSLLTVFIVVLIDLRIQPSGFHAERQAAL